MADNADDGAQGPGLFAVVGALIALCAAGVAIVIWAIELRTTTDPLTLGIVTNHFPAVIGLPMAGIGAFIVVALLRQTQGPIEFEGLGFRFRGASGPVVLWMVCFLSIAGAIKLLW